MSKFIQSRFFFGYCNIGISLHGVLIIILEGIIYVHVVLRVDQNIIMILPQLTWSLTLISKQQSDLVSTHSSVGMMYVFIKMSKYGTRFAVLSTASTTSYTCSPSFDTTILKNSYSVCKYNAVKRALSVRPTNWEKRINSVHFQQLSALFSSWSTIFRNGFR